jgi:hypothetical protein
MFSVNMEYLWSIWINQGEILYDFLINFSILSGKVIFYWNSEWIFGFFYKILIYLSTTVKETIKSFKKIIKLMIYVHMNFKPVWKRFSKM